MQRYPRILIIAALTALALGGCQVKSGNSAAKADKADDTPAVPVEVAQAHTGSISASYSGTATLEARREAEVVARVGGVVKSLAVEEGDHVEEGQVLAKLDDAELKLQVEQARASLGKLKQDFQRKKQLYDRHLVSSADFETAKYDLAAQQAALDMAELKLRWTEIRAPYSGVVTDRYIKAGNMIQANQAAFHVADFKPLIANVFVPETQLAVLEAGQPASLRVDAMPGREFTAHVDRINPAVDAKTGTFKVVVQADDPQHKLRPGMFARVRIVHDVRQDALLVPRAAIVNEDGRDYVFTVQDGTAKRTDVTLGLTDDQKVQIQSGLKAGATVVTVGQNSLRDGSKVSIAGGTPSGEHLAAQQGE